MQQNVLYGLYFYSVLLPFLCRFVECGSETSNIKYANVELKVMNGVPANLTSVPYQVAFKAMVNVPNNIYRTFCGGTLVAPNKLISAGHCFETKRSKCLNWGSRNIPGSKKLIAKTIVVAGNLNNQVVCKDNKLVNDVGQVRRLSRLVYPKNYDFPISDISVGYVNKAFKINENVKPIPYATVKEEYKGPCLVSGFGRISKTGKSEILLIAKLDLYSTKECSKRHSRDMKKFICTSDSISDTGKGDSGGPLVCKGTKDPNEGKDGILVGVVSGKSNRGGTFFTRISSYTDFFEGASFCTKLFHCPELICITTILLLII